MKKFFVVFFAAAVMMISCDFDGTQEAAEAGRNYAIKEHVWANTSPSDPNYNMLYQELKTLRSADFAKYHKNSKQWKAYNKAQTETNLELYSSMTSR